MEVPLVTTRGKFIVTNNEGIDECELLIPELINYKNISDIMTSNKIIKRWSEHFYITRGPDFTEKIDDGSGNTLSNPNSIGTWVFSKEDFETIGLPLKENNISIISPIFRSVTEDEFYTKTLSFSDPYMAIFYYDEDNDNFIFKCKARDLHVKKIYNETKGYFCYQL